MKVLVETFLIYAAFLQFFTDGLKCWNCLDARGSGDCIRKGRIQTCRPNEMMCANEVRNINGMLLVTKRCKQENACINNQVQNDRPASIKQQCNPAIQSSVCRCCCGSDTCNSEGLSCLKGTTKPTCQPLPQLLNGNKKCHFMNVPDEVGAVCTYSCNEGYELMGSGEKTCVAIGNEARYEPAGTPECKTPYVGPITCPKDVIDGFKGTVNCSKNNEIGSVCLFSCDDDHVRDGSPSIKCGPGGVWSGPPPTCLPKCEQQVAPTNGYVMCSLESMETTCKFTCEPGFFLEGPDSTFCTLVTIDGVKQFQWSYDPPLCKPMPSCSEPKDITNGYYNCSDSSLKAGTICEYFCFNGVPNPSLTVCLPNGMWSEVVLEHCNTCPEPNMQPDKFYDFTDSYNIGSIGTQVCGQGKLYASNREMTDDDDEDDSFEELSEIWCLDDGTWSSEFTPCKSLKDCPKHGALENGRIFCTSGNKVESVCTFSCFHPKGLYKRVGAERSTCQEDGTWSDPKPTCVGVDEDPEENSFEVLEAFFNL